MASDVKKYVVSCAVCQVTKPSQRQPAGLKVPIQPQRPWEYTDVDYAGRSLAHHEEMPTSLSLWTSRSGSK